MHGFPPQLCIRSIINITEIQPAMLHHASQHRSILMRRPDQGICTQGLGLGGEGALGMALAGAYNRQRQRCAS
jgi:hypothetical protein